VVETPFSYHTIAIRNRGVGCGIRVFFGLESHWTHLTRRDGGESYAPSAEGGTRAEPQMGKNF
jgi:hypothetical protein